MHDARVPIRKASLSAMFPNGQIGRFATQGALFETSVVAKFGFALQDAQKEQGLPSCGTSGW